jgi:DNA helicase-2/ATP-dependent DNA helicase PcrA
MNAVAEAVAKIWSPYQQAIFSHIENLEAGNLIVEAVAGSGKSTTIVEACKRIPQGKTCILLAFNKNIATELQQRGVNAKTFHSLCFGPVMRHRKTNNVETNKLRTLCKENMSSNDSFIYSAFCAKMVGFARNAGIGCLVADTEQVWQELADHHDMEMENERGSLAKGLEYSRQLLDWSNDSYFVDFDDMLYFAVKDGLVLPKYDYIFVDESQDTNPIQRAIVRKICHENSRVVFVGDPAQAIYGFRGADSESMAMLAEEFECEHLPLTISYRCANNVVKVAQRYINHIEAAPDAPDGNIVRLETREHLANIIAKTSTGQGGEEVYTFGERDLVVCRTTKPLVELAFRLVRNNVPVRIMGRDIGNGLKTLIGKMRATDLDDLAVKIETWATREINKAIAKQLDAKADQAQDKCDAIICLIDGLHEGNRTIDALLQGIDYLFDENKLALTLCTIHKAKGLEAERVWWLNSSACPARWAKQEWQKKQELNLCYVAVTRAKTTLLFIEDGSNTKRK